MTRRPEPGCAAAREAIHATLDALAEAGLRESLDAHLAGCSACRELAAEMAALQRGLRELPEHELPGAALEAVWRRTLRAAPATSWARPRVFATAAAAALVLVLGGLWLRQEPAPAGPTEEELERAAREARMVLRLASDALRRTEHAAFDDVLAGEVSGALRRVPIRWPAREESRRRGS